MYRYPLLLLLCSFVFGEEPLQKIIFSSDYVQRYGSRCIDGTPSGYYYRPSDATPTSTDSTSWVIFLEGGGLCVEPVDCYDRMKTKHGSSNYWTETMLDSVGLLSRNNTINPFAGFNHVFVPYCSGDTHTGTINSKDILGFFFSGHLTLNAICDHLKATTKISQATTILFSGESAGGIGVYNNADFISKQFPHAIVKAAPQAGYFFPETIVLYEEWLVGINDPFPPLISEYLSTIFRSYADESCAAANPSHSELCWDAAFVYPYIETPMFLVNNIFDTSQLEFLGWFNETDDARKYLAYFGDSLVSSVLYGVGNSSKEDGFFLVSCYDHTGNLCMASQTRVKDILYSEVLADWFFERNQLSHHLLDTCWHKDTTPCNLVCPHLCG